ncbi:MAG: hypothetical protein ACE5JU_08930 [Candidatus Binatia bacterium]
MLVYKAALDLSYWFVVPEAGYYALSWNFNVAKLVESYVLALGVQTLMPRSGKRLSHRVMWLLVVLSYVPMLTVFALADGPRMFVYGVTGFWLLVLFMSSLIPAPRLPRVKQSQAKVIYISLYICMAIVSLFVIYEYLGFAAVFDLAKAYDIRSEFVQAGLPLKGYYFHWMANVLNPIFLVICIANKRWLLSIAIILLQLFIASSVGLRSYYFVLPFALGVVWVLTRKNSLWALGVISSVVVILELVLFVLARSILEYTPLLSVEKLFLVPVHARALFVPAQLSFYYYDFFSLSGPIPFVYHFKYFFKVFEFREYSYAASPANLVGAEYFGKPELAAVTGIVGDAYMNVGFLGLVLWAMVLVVLLKLVDGCSKGVDLRIGIAAIAMPSLSMSSTYLIRAVVTGGLLLSVVMLFLLRSRRDSYNV